jgi:hypothetical protein
MGHYLLVLDTDLLAPSPDWITDRSPRRLVPPGLQPPAL